MKPKGQDSRQLVCSTAGRYENTAEPPRVENGCSTRLSVPGASAQPAWAVGGGPVHGSSRLAMPVHAAGSGRAGPAVAADGSSSSSYLGHNLNFRPYAITLYPFCAQVLVMIQHFSHI